MVDQRDLKFLEALELSKVEELTPQLELFRAISPGFPARKFLFFLNSFVDPVFQCF